MINGVNLNDPAQNQITFQPSINTVSEFKVDNSTFSAEYGRNSGRHRQHRHALGHATTSTASCSSSSGTTALDSRNFFNPSRRRRSRRSSATSSAPTSAGRSPGTGRSSSRTYEGLRQRQGIDINSGVLRDDQRAAVTDPVSRQPAAAHPGRQRDRRERRRPLHRLGAPRRWTSTSGRATSSTPSASTTRCTATTRSSATCRGEPTLQLQHHPRIRRHAAFAPPDHDPERDPRLRTERSSTRRASASIASTSPSSRTLRLEPGRLRHQRRRDEPPSASRRSPSPAWG